MQFFNIYERQITFERELRMNDPHGTMSNNDISTRARQRVFTEGIQELLQEARMPGKHHVTPMEWERFLELQEHVNGS